MTEVRFLFDYDRWATRRVLDALDGLDGLGGDAWPAGAPIGTRTIGDILVHALGAHQRWRLGLSGSDEQPEPENGPLPTIAGLHDAWEVEWQAFDAWLADVDESFLARERDGVAVWQMLAHLVNHGTQHRSEAAALLTGAGRSPGEIDMIYFAEERAGSAS